MKFIETKFQGLFLIERDSFPDNRGVFSETFISDLLKNDFDYDCFSKSKKGVIRGLHYQKGLFSQQKYVYVIDGVIQDVVMDVNKRSPDYGKYLSFTLSSENNLGIFIPHGMAHGFQCLSETAIVGYKIEGNYIPEYVSGIHYSEVNWEIKENIIISEKDENLPKL
jgi:dTDP-4-dehydrorhamnose 3,5-epimerase